MEKFDDALSDYFVYHLFLLTCYSGCVYLHPHQPASGLYREDTVLNVLVSQYVAQRLEHSTAIKRLRGQIPTVPCVALD